ncbi:N-acetylmuramoyl-L-alanine amidase [Aquisalimonas asiatica]|uniref:N-acetylmuramoyl-L-alanine amidase n=2 Tax=Aquisalimonas asiatica TaxID=406100 RepID=A0A1H8R0J3_9GAMM|nr:N-acetylmuramoyl-L-alanine amidase [Aquisalimonas asiatica]
MARLLTLLMLFVVSSTLVASQVQVENVRTSAGSERTRVVFDLSGEVDHRVFNLKDPDRVVIDITGAALSDASSISDAGLVQRMRSAARGEGDLRVVLDTDGPVRTQSFLVRPNDQYGHRLVVDLHPGEERDEPVRTAEGSAQRDFVVAIDPGHGGRDPGAIGPTGLTEKEVVLEVGRKLYHLLDEAPGIKPLMIRDSDIYVPLSERRETARSNNADIFVSLHADATESGGPRGSSVYTLSQTGASSQAASLLAQRENAADLLGDISLSDKDDMTRSVLVDLSRGATLEASVELAGDVLHELAGVGPIHRGDVERAGFVVLKSLDMPSVLVELAFISNPEEERRLREADHQWDLARAVASGVNSYAERHRPSGARMASSGREYEVQSGDTLSGIASEHRVSVSDLRSANDLNGDVLSVGTTLRIPE